jgi:hypothetical protein
VPCQAPLEKGDLKEHLIRYWLTPPADAHLEEKVTDICTLYQEAPVLAQQGEQVLSTDELTGVQALERRHPGLPQAPGKVERREFESIRHGTSALLLSRDVVSGKLVAPWCGQTRTEEDFLTPVQQGVATCPQARRGHFVLDNLNLHHSASLVRWVVYLSGITDDLGVKGRSGILATQASRAVFVRDPTHKVVFHYTPTHSSWLHQIEIWLSILVRKLLRGGVLYLVGRLANQSAGVHRL